MPLTDQLGLDLQDGQIILAAPRASLLTLHALGMPCAETTGLDIDAMV